MRTLIDTLPPDVPEGTDPSEPLAACAIHPRLCIPDDADLPTPEGDEAWIYLDPILNNVLGFGKTAADIALSVRRGALGVEGVFMFLLACVEEIGIGAGLLEGKVERLCDALELRCVTEYIVLSILLIFLSFFFRGASVMAAAVPPGRPSAVISVESPRKQPEIQGMRYVEWVFINFIFQYLFYCLVQVRQ